MFARRLINRLLGRSLCREEGAVTVDWVVLTAAVVGLAGAVFSILQDPVNGAATSIANKIETSP
jgi:hypothetical protein